MSAPYIIPFNFQPVNTGISNSTYTVPAGKYARVVVNLSASARIFNTSLVATGGEAIAVSNNTQSLSVEVWARAGEAFSASTSAPAPAPSSSVNIIASAVAVLNGNLLASVYAPASGLIFTSSGDTVEANSIAEVSFRYEEYNQIS
jgi:hypothetical protein